MTTTLRSVLIMVVCIFAPPTSAQNPDTQRGKAPAAQQAVPNWASRGIPGAGHAALAPLVGSWRVELSIYGTMGRSPDLPPIVSNDIRTTRVWVADGQYIEDTTEGAVEGQPYWRRGWLGYSNIDRRYEWVTIAPRVPMMIYLGKPGSGEQMPIDVTGVFTDQGVVSEQTVGKPVVQRTVFRIESNDRHISELYFTPPGGKERLALRLVYTRIKSESDQRVIRQRGIVLPKLPEPALPERAREGERRSCGLSLRGKNSFGLPGSMSEWSRADVTLRGARRPMRDPPPALFPQWPGRG